MSRETALKIAIGLLHLPSQLRLVRDRPLPDDVPSILRIVAGDNEALEETVRATGRDRAVLREAAAFFIEQVLFAPDADSYRVLGVRSNASRDELRRNMILLIRWLHPDLVQTNERSMFVARVTNAWDDLKTPERRATYDEARYAERQRKSRHRGRSPARYGFGKPSSGKHRNKVRPIGNEARPSSPYKQLGGGHIALWRRVLPRIFARIGR